MSPREMHILDVDPALARAARLSGVGAVFAGERVTGTILLTLLGAGAGVATVALDFNLRIPGHAVLRSLLPMALGLSLIPRRGGGTVMAISACAAVLLVGVAQGSRVAGPGSLTSLILLGPLLDFGLRGGRTVVSRTAALAACGLAVNLVAFGVRLGAKLASAGSGRPVSQWWPNAVTSYVICGLLAGLLASVLFFRLRLRDRLPAQTPGAHRTKP